ncbi:MAG: hypothetical protein EHM51_02320, partial [Geobacter sp.]
MTEKERTRKGLKRLLPRVLIVSGVVLCLSLASVYLATAIYVRTPSAARQAEQILTDYLHYPVTITSLGLTGGTLSIRGLRIKSPGEFKGEFLSTRSIAITPDWFAFLRGRNIFREIALRELSVTISRNRRGELNVDQLIRDLSRQKGGDETFIQRLVIRQAGITMEGFQLQNLAFNLRDFSTKGTTGARFLLTCKDVDGDILRLEGTGRLGAVPSLEMAFSAPSVSLQALAQSFGRKAGRDLGSSKGSVSLAIRLHERIVAAQGKFRVDHLPLAIQNYKFPVSGELDFGGRYDISGDQAFLDACSLRLNGIVDIQGSGT